MENTIDYKIFKTTKLINLRVEMAKQAPPLKLYTQDKINNLAKKYNY